MAADFGLHVPGYEVLEELSAATTVCLLKVQGPDKKFKLWKCYDLRNGAQAVEMKHLGLLKRLHHSYLNAVTNFFHLEDQEVLVVESDLPSLTLKDRLEECKASSGNGIPTEELLQYMEQAADVIDFLTTPQHDFQGKKIAIFHRSLRPDSLHIFDLGARRVCKVADFGLAKPVTEIDESVRHSLGLTNYEYSPPEYDEGTTSATSDQYSLAVIYYEMRTGALPFQGSMLARLQAQLAGTPTLDLVSEAEGEIITKALSRDPKARYATCKEFVKALKALLSKGSGLSPALPSTVRASSMYMALEPVPALQPGSDAKATPGSGPRPSLAQMNVTPAANPRATMPRTGWSSLTGSSEHPAAPPGPVTPSGSGTFRSMAPVTVASDAEFQDLPEPESEPEIIQHDGGPLGTKAQSLRQSLKLNDDNTDWKTWLVVVLTCIIGIVAFYFLIVVNSTNK
jgi:serine/threonine protein kinase